MKKVLIIFTLSLFTLAFFAQDLSIEYFEQQLKQINDKIQSVERVNASQDVQIRFLNQSLVKANEIIDSLQRQIHANSVAINQTAQSLGVKISETNKYLSNDFGSG